MNGKKFNYTLSTSSGGFMITSYIKVKVNCTFEYDGSTYLVVEELDEYNLNAIRL